MGNIWDVFLFTLCVSFTGLVLLLFKYLFRDKLSARWHYFVWGVLFLRAVLPPDWRLFYFDGAMNAVWVEFIRKARMLAERGMNPLPIEVSVLFHTGFEHWPWTDKLFALYLFGVLAVILYHAAIYIFLRLQISRGRKASPALRQKAANAAAECGVKKYGEIRVCRGFKTPFVCGFLRPVLVVPEEMEETIDRKVLLHEMLHMKHYDVLVNFLLHFLTALNWFNPLVYLLCSVIRNDSEALCDQRVLERLEGAERKKYGYLLLNMADSRRSSRIGTTSMANGAKNIKIRLRRIADFGRVPKGASFAAACITILLCLSAISYGAEPKFFDTDGVETEKDLAAMLDNARFFHVSSPEMAVNIYREALEERDMVKMALVVPEDCFEAYKDWAMGQYRQGRCDGARLEHIPEEGYAYALHDNQGEEKLDFYFLNYKKGECCSGKMRIYSMFYDEENPQTDILAHFLLEKEEGGGWCFRITEKTEAKREETPDEPVINLSSSRRELQEKEIPTEMERYGDWLYKEGFFCGETNVLDEWSSGWSAWTEWGEEVSQEFSEQLTLNAGTNVWLEYAGDPAELPEIYGQAALFCICPAEMEDVNFFRTDSSGNLDISVCYQSSTKEKYCCQSLVLDEYWASHGYFLDENRQGEKGLYLETPINWGGYSTTIEQGMKLVENSRELRIYGIIDNEQKRVVTIPLKGLNVYE